MYSGDHNPPHFHVLTPDERGSLSIENFEILAGELSSQSVKTALTWAADNRGLLIEKWKELNG
jgi:hypothetical protein